MAEKFSALHDGHVEFIGKQHLFFVGTAGAEGYVNVSPKGMDTFRVVSHSEVIWLNLTGSGNESAAHVLENARMTIMFCSFDKQPLIMRLYGQARVVHPADDSWQSLVDLFPENVGARQIFRLKLDLVQTSCGYAVPYYQLLGERPTLTNWADKRGREGIEQYWRDNNTRSLDNKDTGIFSATSETE
jgi:predicted pyridoxine 5'-phosphate oxidase superfamily flavin-nucleotide-binding protein